jgi:hypothetical protein
MRRAVVLIALAAGTSLAACEIQPAPKKQPVPVEVPSPPPPQLPQVPQPPPVVADAGTGEPPPIAASKECIDVAAHVVQVFISTAQDPAQGAVYEQERMKMTRATAEACDKQGWSPAAMKCYLAAKNPVTIKACENKFPPPPPQPKPGAGSAAPTPAPTGGRGPAVDPGAPAAKGSGAIPKAAAPKGAGSAAPR